MRPWAAGQFLDVTAQSIAAANWDDEDVVDAVEASADERYEWVSPSDQALEDAFRRQLTDGPEAFTPIWQLH